VTACGTCGTELRVTARFCDDCGAPVARLPDSAEYKQVTALFADVVRSMDIAAAVDIERLREIMTEVAQRSAAVVHRYGGGRIEYTGDGLMALFGAPTAIEDHAFRACLAALAIQDEANRLAVDVLRRDGVQLRMRVGLNSGRVIAGEIGSAAIGYTATGQSIGFAQRMESVAPPGGVMLSESTARLVEHAMTLGEVQWMRIKGTDNPVPARQLLGTGRRNSSVGRAEAHLVGRQWEMTALNAILDRAIQGHGGVVTVVGPPGIGKSRTAREIATLAIGRGVELHWTFCESHTGDVPFAAVAGLLREASGIVELDDPASRARVRQQFHGADPQDLQLLDDLLGIADATVSLPHIDPDARRRRLTALINTASLARTQPALYIIEDAHWIDAVSESMLADFLTVVPHTPSMVLITARPEYQGLLMRVHGSQTIAFAPLEDSDVATLITELLGTDSSVKGLATIVAERAAGNPFFAEEMVRDLFQRGILTGDRGNYVCHTNVDEVAVPATVQAAIEARIDRLAAPAKRTLNAASIIGARFDAELLSTLGINAAIDELLDAELVDQVGFTPTAQYAFCHPLIRAVAYESQLKTDRAQWHRRLASAIEERQPELAEENAALIAEHLQAAGELRAAYGWHLRAATWSTNRDIAAARVSWERAQGIADQLHDGQPDTLSMRIAPRTMLCATDWQAQAFQETRGRFAELQELCAAAEDKVSLAIGMSGLVSELLMSARPEGSRLASEQMALLGSIGNADLTIGLAFVAFANWFNTGDFDEILRWSQVVIDVAEGDPARGAGFGLGAPLAIAVTFRGVARWWLGRPGWRRDLDDAVAMARDHDPTTLGVVIPWTYGLAIVYGLLPPDDAALRTIDEAVQIAQRASSDIALIFVEYCLGRALLYQDRADHRRRGLDIMMQALDWQRQRMPALVPNTELIVAEEEARNGDRDTAITKARRAVHELQQAQRAGYAIAGIGILVEMLFERGTEADVSEAREAIDWLAKLPAAEDWAVVRITLLRLRALQARACGDDPAYRDLVNRYAAMAKSCGFEGHLAWAEGMAESRQ